MALVDIGDPSQPSFDGDGYFDTATWGDMGGNLFVARFHEPGVVDGTTRRVTNWYAARTFEEQRRADDQQYATGRSPIFFMTANTFDPQGKALHTYVGSGNRERIMQQGEACGPDNLFGCCRGGCSVTDSTTVDSYGACGFTNHFRCESGKMMRDTTASTCTGTDAASCAASPGNAFTSTVTLQYTCPDVTHPHRHRGRDLRRERQLPHAHHHRRRAGRHLLRGRLPEEPLLRRALLRALHREDLLRRRHRHPLRAEPLHRHHDRLHRGRALHLHAGATATWSTPPTPSPA